MRLFGKAAVEKILVLPDTHCPFHDRRAFALVELVARRFRPRRLIVGGDFADCWTISTHRKDPARAERTRFKDEVAETRALLRRIESWGSVERHYFLGNHEDRLTRYLADRAPELYGVGMTIDELFSLSDHGWTVIPYREHARIGKIWMTHDIGQSGTNALRQAFAAYQDNIVINHTHRLEYFVKSNATGVSHVAASFGWLGDAAKVDYMYRVKMRDWALGFGIGYVRPNGTVHLQPVPIVNYSCVVEGHVYEVS